MSINSEQCLLPSPLHHAYLSPGHLSDVTVIGGFCTFTVPNTGYHRNTGTFSSSTGSTLLHHWRKEAGHSQRRGKWGWGWNAARLFTDKVWCFLLSQESFKVRNITGTHTKSTGKCVSRLGKRQWILERGWSSRTMVRGMRTILLSQSSEHSTGFRGCATQVKFSYHLPTGDS